MSSRQIVIRHEDTLTPGFGLYWRRAGPAAGRCSRLRQPARCASRCPTPLGSTHGQASATSPLAWSRHDYNLRTAAPKDYAAPDLFEAPPMTATGPVRVISATAAICRSVPSDAVRVWVIW